MHPHQRQLQTLSRRHLLQDSVMGLGCIALSSLLSNDLPAAEKSAPRAGGTHAGLFPPRARNVIFLHMVGAPSHLDLFDYKPELQRLNGQLVPDTLRKWAKSDK